MSWSCKDCQERYVGCHAKCEKYKAESEAHRAEKERIRQVKQGKYEAHDVLQCGVYRAMKKKRA